MKYRGFSILTDSDRDTWSVQYIGRADLPSGHAIFLATDWQAREADRTKLENELFEDIDSFIRDLTTPQESGEFPTIARKYFNYCEARNMDPDYKYEGLTSPGILKKVKEACGTEIFIQEDLVTRWREYFRVSQEGELIKENEKISEHSKRTYSGNLRIYSKLEGYAFCLVINSGPYYRIHCGSEVIADKVAKLFGIYECKKFALRQVKERRKERAKKK